MYKLMIVDDEPTVRNGLKGLIDWNSYGFELCGEAEDGEEGLEKVLQFQPDLVLADIKMPEMGGIEMMREARKQGFQGKCIILTGYSSFEYAKQAIEVDVEAYILKPINEEELMDCVKKIYEKIKQREEQEQNKTENEQKARKEALRALLLCMEDKHSLIERMERYSFDMNCRKFCVAVVETKKDDGMIEYDQLSAEKQKLFLFGLDNVEVLYLENRLVLIRKNSNMEETRRVLQKSNDRVKERYEEGFFIAVGHEVVQWEDVHFSYESAKLMYSHKFLFGNDEVVTLESFRIAKEAAEENGLEELLKLIEIGEEAAVKSFFDNQNEYYRSQLKSEAEVKFYYLGMLPKVYMRIEEMYGGTSKSIPTLNEIGDEVRKAESLNELTDILTRSSIEISRQVACNGTNIIQRVLTYMERHYHEDLNVQAVADIFNYNSAYLGKLFKETTGEGFISTLDRIRIEQAKKLILEGNLKVYQIAEKVGYKDTTYFYTKFKKYVWKSPKEIKSK